MADRVNWFFRQLVTEAELDEAFDKIEAADRALATDLALIGISSGGVVSQHAGTPNLTVDISGPAIAYDQTGQRIRFSALQTVDVSQDDASVTTAVSGGGNEKWVSVFLKFTRALSDPRVDGNSNTVYFEVLESFEFSVVQGAEAAIGLATRPALIGDGLLLADINRTQGQTQILNAAISTTRRQDMFVVSGTPNSLRVGTIPAAVSAILADINAHIVDTTDAHTSAAIGYAGGTTWLDGSTNPATTVKAQLDKVITDLKSTTSGSSGGEKLGTRSVVGTSGTISAGSIHSVLLALKSSSAHEYTAPGTTWANGVAFSSNQVQGAIDTIFIRLSDKAGVGANGASCVGFQPQGNIAADTVEGALVELDTEKAALDGATFSGGVAVSPGAFLSVSGPFTLDRANKAYLGYSSQILTDADTTSLGAVDASDQGTDQSRVPTITGNRIYKFIAQAPDSASVGKRRRHRITRVRTGDAFSVTIQRNGGATLGVIPASQAGWIECEYSSGSADWVVSAWSSNVTSINTDTG